MSELAIDRFRVSPRQEAEAQHIAAQLGSYGDPAMLLGYLKASVAVFLETPRWASRDRLAVDLRTVQLVWERRHG